MPPFKPAQTFIPKKSLGQNFLINPSVQNRIIEACDLKSSDTILEIGPGTGALTHLLAQRVGRVIAVEKDHALADHLKKNFDQTNVHIIEEDILTFPFETLPNPVKAIGNLPYNIATPIIEKIITHRPRFTSLYITVQWEYAQRMVAKPHSKSFGSLSCFIQYYATPKILFKIGRSAFQPSPKVQSCFVEINLHPQRDLIALDEKRLFQIIRACFNQRRKTVCNSLSALISKMRVQEILEIVGVNLKWRAEDLSLDEYIQIANVISEAGTIEGNRKKTGV